MELRIEDLVRQGYVRAETDIIYGCPVYCIECGTEKWLGERVRMYFYESQGPFCDRICFADYLGVSEEILPKIKQMGKIK